MTGVQTCALPISKKQLSATNRKKASQATGLIDDAADAPRPRTNALPDVEVAPSRGAVKNAAGGLADAGVGTGNVSRKTGTALSKDKLKNAKKSSPSLSKNQQKMQSQTVGSTLSENIKNQTEKKEFSVNMKKTANPESFSTKINCNDTTRVGRWMSEGEYEKMEKTKRVQMSDGNKVHVANPADINAFGKQAPKGSIYVEFNVPSNTIFPGGKPEWGIIAGPNSLNDKLNRKKGLPPITEMPRAENIEIKGRK